MRRVLAVAIGLIWLLQGTTARGEELTEAQSLARQSIVQITVNCRPKDIALSASGVIVRATEQHWYVLTSRFAIDPAHPSQWYRGEIAFDSLSVTVAGKPRAAELVWLPCDDRDLALISVPRDKKDMLTAATLAELPRAGVDVAVIGAKGTAFSAKCYRPVQNRAEYALQRVAFFGVEEPIAFGSALVTADGNVVGIVDARFLLAEYETYRLHMEHWGFRNDTIYSSIGRAAASSADDKANEGIKSIVSGVLSGNLVGLFKGINTLVKAEDERQTERQRLNQDKKSLNVADAEREGRDMQEKLRGAEVTVGALSDWEDASRRRRFDAIKAEMTLPAGSRWLFDESPAGYAYETHDGVSWGAIVVSDNVDLVGGITRGLIADAIKSREGTPAKPVSMEVMPKSESTNMKGWTVSGTVGEKKEYRVESATIESGLGFESVTVFPAGKTPTEPSLAFVPTSVRLWIYDEDFSELASRDKGESGELDTSLIIKWWSADGKERTYTRAKVQDKNKITHPVPLLVEVENVQLGKQVFISAAEADAFSTKDAGMVFNYAPDHPGTLLPPFFGEPDPKRPGLQIIGPVDDKGIRVWSLTVATDYYHPMLREERVRAAKENGGRDLGRSVVSIVKVPN